MFQNEIIGIGKTVREIKIEKESYRLLGVCINMNIAFSLLQPIYAFYDSVWCFINWKEYVYIQYVSSNIYQIHVLEFKLYYHKWLNRKTKK